MSKISQTSQSISFRTEIFFHFLSFWLFICLFHYVYVKIRSVRKSVRAHSTQHASADPCALHLHTVQLLDADKSSFVIILVTGDSTGSQVPFVYDMSYIHQWRIDSRTRNSSLPVSKECILSVLPQFIIIWTVCYISGCQSLGYQRAARTFCPRIVELDLYAFMETYPSVPTLPRRSSVLT
jgi:hypothetical protein